MPNAEAAVQRLAEMRISEHDCYKDIAQLVKGTPIENALRNQGESLDIAPSLLHVTLVRFVVTYIKWAQRRDTLDEEAFLKVWELLINELKHPNWVWIRRTPLMNFTLAPDAPPCIKLAEGVQIRPIADEERIDWDNGPALEMLKWPALARETHLIEIIYEGARHDLSDLTPPILEQEILFALRVLGLAQVAYRLTEVRLGSAFMASIHYENFSAARNEEVVALSALQSNSFLMRWQSYQAMRVNERFAFASRRFGDGHQRTIPEDSLVDYWTALESLYSRRREGAKGVRKRVSRRIAVAIAGNDRATCEQAYDVAHSSYRLRSDVVHGGPDQVVTAADVKPIYSLLRDSLGMILDSRQLPNLAKLDKDAESLLGS